MTDEFTRMPKRKATGCVKERTTAGFVPRENQTLKMTAQRDFTARILLLVAPRILHNRKNNATDCEIKEQAPIFLEEAVSDRGRQVRHEQVVDRVPGQHGHKRIQEIFHCRCIPPVARFAFPRFGALVLQRPTSC
jgi:hypothetical protein